MVRSLIRQALGIYRKRHNPSFIHRRRRRKLPLSTRQGLLLIFGIGTFVALVFILIYYIWYLPMEKSMRQGSGAQSPASGGMTQFQTVSTKILPLLLCEHGTILTTSGFG